VNIEAPTRWKESTRGRLARLGVTRFCVVLTSAMYIPSSFAERDAATLFAFIEAHPLATLVTTSPTDGLIATHLPLVLDRNDGPNGVLRGHLARANPHARVLASDVTSALVMFLGPDAYVTPTWYHTKKETGRAVPTWNYVAVHAYCTLRTFDNPHDLRPHLERLTHQHESGRPDPWHVDDAPEDYVVTQMKAIVGVRLEIERLEGKWKMSQNRSAADVSGVVHGLSMSDNPRDRQVAQIVDERSS
jgi:transcriptional regulator